MGRDKALLPHPEGGTWLERTLRLLLEYARLSDERREKMGFVEDLV